MNTYALFQASGCQILFIVTLCSPQEKRHHSLPMLLNFGKVQLIRTWCWRWSRWLPSKASSEMSQGDEPGSLYPESGAGIFPSLPWQMAAVATRLLILQEGEEQMPGPAGSQCMILFPEANVSCKWVHTHLNIGCTLDDLNCPHPTELTWKQPPLRSMKHFQVCMLKRLFPKHASDSSLTWNWGPIASLFHTFGSKF